MKEADEDKKQCAIKQISATSKDTDLFIIKMSDIKNSK